jgi:hypothetical protein
LASVSASFLSVADAFEQRACAIAGRMATIGPGMLQSSKERAKPGAADLFGRFLFQAPMRAVALGNGAKFGRKSMQRPHGRLARDR